MYVHILLELEADNILLLGADDIAIHTFKP